MINLSVVKKADRNFVFCGLGAIISYSIIITNSGTTEATSVKITDLLGKGQCFVQDSLVINEEKQNITSLETGVDIGIVPSKGNTILRFDVSVEKDNIINQVESQPIVSYSDEEGKVQEIISNKIVIPEVTLDICTNKTDDKQEVRIGEAITYTITINNKGSESLNKVRLYDVLPQGLMLLPGTMTVNSVQKDVQLNGSVILDNLLSHSSSVITFKAQVMSYPLGGVLQNKVYIHYKYTQIIEGTAYNSIGESCAIPHNISVIS